MPLQQIAIQSSMLDLRIDRIIKDSLGLSVATANKLARGGDVRLCFKGAHTKAAKVKDLSQRLDSFIINKAERIEVFVPASIGTQQVVLKGREAHFEGVKKNPAIVAKLKSLESKIIFEDANILVLNKPSGLAVQGGSGLRFSIDDFLQYLTHRLTDAPRIVHRIDKDTHGIVIFAKTQQVAKHLTKLFADGMVDKTYMAAVPFNHNLRQSGVIDCYVKKVQFKAIALWHASGQDGFVPATTHYKLLSDDEISVSQIASHLKQFGVPVLLKPKTGRYHQLRVQLSLLKSPIIGDVIYGNWQGHQQNAEPPQDLKLYAIGIEFELFGTKYRISL